MTLALEAPPEVASAVAASEEAAMDLEEAATDSAVAALVVAEAVAEAVVVSVAVAMAVTVGLVAPVTVALEVVHPMALGPLAATLAEAVEVTMLCRYLLEMSARLLVSS